MIECKSSIFWKEALVCVFGESMWTQQDLYSTLIYQCITTLESITMFHWIFCAIGQSHRTLLWMWRILCVCNLHGYSKEVSQGHGLFVSVSTNSQVNKNNSYVCPLSGRGGIETSKRGMAYRWINWCQKWSVSLRLVICHGMRIHGKNPKPYIINNRVGENEMY